MKTCNCNSHNISTYSRLTRFDPTHTMVLREAFAADMKRRFNKLKKLIVQTIVDQDCFGLKPDAVKITALAAPQKEAFAFPTSAEKTESFMSWLRKQEDSLILETGKTEQLGTALNPAWTDMYIQDSYSRGVQRARYELNKAGYDVPKLTGAESLAASLQVPIHLDRIGILYTRVFTDLKGITSAMDGQISKILAQGLIDGKSPGQLAKLLNRTITGPSGDLGITDTLGRYIPAERRALMLARTEIIRAHHQASIQEYENWKVAGVMVLVEWSTAGWLVCRDCQNMSGKEFTLEEIRMMIPYHPNCRCCAIPKRVIPYKQERKARTIPSRGVPAASKEKLPFIGKPDAFG